MNNEIKTWQERYNANGGSVEDCANAEIAELRAKVESLTRDNLELSRRHEEQKLQEQRLEVAMAREKAKVESLAADAARWRFSQDFQNNPEQPQPEPILAMWRKVYAEGRRNPTPEEYEQSMDASIALAKEKA